MSIYYTDSALFVIVYFCGNIDDLIGVSVVIVALKEHLYLLLWSEKLQKNGEFVHISDIDFKNPIFVLNVLR